MKLEIIGKNVIKMQLLMKVNHKKQLIEVILINIIHSD